MKLSLFLIACTLILMLGFRRHQAVVPLTRNDTDKTDGIMVISGHTFPDQGSVMPKLKKGNFKYPSTFGAAKDTVKPAYRYFFTIDPIHLNNLLYVTDSLILNDFGVELSGTVIKNSKKFYIDYKEALLRSGIRKDSVKIKP